METLRLRWKFFMRDGQGLVPGGARIFQGYTPLDLPARGQPCRIRRIFGLGLSPAGGSGLLQVCILRFMGSGSVAALPPLRDLSLFASLHIPSPGCRQRWPAKSIRARARRCSQRRRNRSCEKGRASLVSEATGQETHELVTVKKLSWLRAGVKAGWLKWTIVPRTRARPRRR